MILLVIYIIDNLVYFIDNRTMINQKELNLVIQAVRRFTTSPRPDRYLELARQSVQADEPDQDIMFEPKKWSKHHWHWYFKLIQEPLEQKEPLWKRSMYPWKN